MGHGTRDGSARRFSVLVRTSWRSTLFIPVSLGALLLTGCEQQAKPDADQAKPTAQASAKSSDDATASPKKDTEPAKAEAKKLGMAGLEALADAVKFEQGAAKDKGFSGKLKNTGEHGIRLLEYKAFAYDKDGKLLERIDGKHSKALDAGGTAEIEVGPFDKAAGKADVIVEVVVSWMNVDGTSWQRPVPKDRAKGGPNSALTK